MAPRTKQGQHWDDRRTELLGTTGTREAVAAAFGLSIRTLIRYEMGGRAPQWYELALEGLAARKRKGQPVG